MIAAVGDIRQRTWDFGLTVLTVALLGLLGVQSFIGTLYVWYSIRSTPGWEQSAGYTGYVGIMNAIAAPQVVALVVVMGLCVPKRLFARGPLIVVSLAMVVVGAVAALALRSLADGLAVYLLLAAAIQLAVVVMTGAGIRGPSYLTEGRLTKTGSGLLHLGFIVFALVVVALQSSPLMIPVFALAGLLIAVGMALSFYAWRFAWHRTRAEREVAFEWSEAANGDDEAEQTEDDSEATETMEDL